MDWVYKHTCNMLPTMRFRTGACKCRVVHIPMNDNEFQVHCDQLWLFSTPRDMFLWGS